MITASAPLTIVLPLYNGERYVRDAVDSEMARITAATFTATDRMEGRLGQREIRHLEIARVQRRRRRNGRGHELLH